MIPNDPEFGDKPIRDRRDEVGESQSIPKDPDFGMSQSELDGMSLKNLKVPQRIPKDPEFTEQPISDGMDELGESQSTPKDPKGSQRIPNLVRSQSEIEKSREKNLID